VRESFKENLVRRGKRRWGRRRMRRRTAWREIWKEWEENGKEEQQIKVWRLLIENAVRENWGGERKDK